MLILKHKPVMDSNVQLLFQKSKKQFIKSTLRETNIVEEIKELDGAKSIFRKSQPKKGFFKRAKEFIRFIDFYIDRSIIKKSEFSAVDNRGSVCSIDIIERKDGSFSFISKLNRKNGDILRRQWDCFNFRNIEPEIPDALTQANIAMHEKHLDDFRNKIFPVREG